jgi:hypothetical protein
MDKYSKKIIKFISTNKINLQNNLENKLQDNELINIIIKKVKKVNKKHFIIPPLKIDKIFKLRNINDDSLLYKFFKEYESNIKTKEDFIKYYCFNQHQLNIQEIKNDIKQDNNKDKLLNLFKNIYERTDNRKELSKIFYNNTFVSLDIIDEIECNDLYHIQINDLFYNISLYYYDNVDYIDEYILKIIKIIYLIKEINDHFEPLNNNKYNVIMFLGNQKKLFMSDRITPISMNSGSSIATIYASVWRKEEFEKVLIHELLHFIEGDFYHHIDGYHKLDNDILKIFNIDGLNNPNEAYNETLAGIINMCYKSEQLKVDINKIYNIEMRFLYLQSAKLIKYFDGSYTEDLLNKKIIIKQTTSALSYLFLKMILFHNINDTLEFIMNIDLKCNVKEKVNKFNNFLINKINDKSYVNNVNAYIE